jgi:GAF domain-containing protein
LIVGDGAATGRGVLTHDLGLPGYLARSLTRLTGHATDVDIVVEGTMTAVTALAALDRADLGRFDVVLVSLGANEALALSSVRRWRADLDLLVTDIRGRTAPGCKIVVLSIPLFAINPHIPAFLAGVVDRHVRLLNAATGSLLTGRPGVAVIPVAPAHVFEAEGSHLYQRWAAGIAVRIDDLLDPDRVQAGSTATGNEHDRQAALRDTEARNTDADPVLDDLTEKARRVLGTSMAAVTLIRSDVQVMKVASGIEPIVLPRAEAFCDTTIRRSRHLVIEDASLDSRYADYSTVTGSPGVRFYAGYPIESPTGQRVGALCVMDSRPRHLTGEEAEALQGLAHQVQEHLWGAALPAV